MKRDYIDHLISSIDCDLSGLRVLVDCANGAASATAPDLFDRPAPARRFHPPTSRTA